VPTVGIRTSVIVPAYQAWATLPQVLEALRPQVDRADRELVLVESSGTLTPQELERRWPWARVVALPERTLPGLARNLALDVAAGEFLAFTDADAVPESGWLDALERALPPSADAVAGSVLNGTPESSIGTSGYLLEFVEWVPRRKGSPRYGVTCNLLVRREALEAAGGFPTEVWPGEDTIFTFRLWEQGRLEFASDASVRHLNRTGLRDFVRHQYRLGTSFAEVCRHIAFPSRKYTRLPFAPVAGLMRLPWLLLRLVRWRALPRAQPGVLPLVVLGACVWSAGLTVAALRSASGTGDRGSV
jgi:GT2 family glycosyltransferase